MNKLIVLLVIFLTIRLLIIKLFLNIYNTRKERKNMRILFNEYSKKSELLNHDRDVVDPIREAMGREFAEFVESIIESAEQCSAEDWDIIEQQGGIIERQKVTIAQLERDKEHIIKEYQNHIKAITPNQPIKVKVKVRRAS